MEKYEIFPIKIGEFIALDHSILTCRMNQGKKIVGPLIVYLIKNKDHCVVVDTGGCDEEWARRYHASLRRSDDEHPASALKKFGVNIESVEYVVNTHLHWDHCFNNDLFTKAKIYVQRKELQYAICPLPIDYPFYEALQLGMYPKWLKNAAQIQPVDGDVNLLPGIDLIALPGHTPGFQGVLVNTEKGKYLIAGDCLGTYANWEGIGHLKHIPSGIHYSLPEYYRTFEKIESICDYILPGHDLKVFEKKKYPAD